MDKIKDDETTQLQACHVEDEPAVTWKTKTFVIYCTVTFMLDCTINFKILYEVLRMGNGLVVGPVSTNFSTALIAFNCISVVLVSFDICATAYFFLTHHQIRGEPIQVIYNVLDVQTHSWLNVVLAACMEYAISVYQFVKAMLMLIVPLVSLATVSHRIRTNAEDPNISSKHPKHIRGLRITVLVGSVLQFLASVLLISMTYVRYDAGEMLIRAPKHSMKDSQDVRTMQKFLDNVCIFYNIQHDKMGWLSLTSIYDVIQAEHGLTVDVAFNKTQLTIKTKRLIWCFELNKSGKSYKNLWCKKSHSMQMVNATQHQFKFRFQSPSDKHLFGNIIYSVSNKPARRLKYFRGSHSCGQVMHHYDTKKGSRYKGFFDKELTDIHKIWKCGWAHCVTTTRDGPKKVLDIEQ